MINLFENDKSYQIIKEFLEPIAKEYDIKIYFTYWEEGYQGFVFADGDENMSTYMQKLTNLNVFINKFFNAIAQIKEEIKDNEIYKLSIEMCDDKSLLGNNVEWDFIF